MVDLLFSGHRGIERIVGWPELHDGMRSGVLGDYKYFFCFIEREGLMGRLMRWDERVAESHGSVMDGVLDHRDAGWRGELFFSP